MNARLKKSVFALSTLNLAAVAALGAFSMQAHAAPRGGSYAAALQSPLEAPRQEIIGGVLWKCVGERCIAPAEGSRPLLVCQRVAKKIGPVARFSSPFGELPAEDLARCNARD